MQTVRTATVRDISGPGLAVPRIPVRDIALLRLAIGAGIGFVAQLALLAMLEVTVGLDGAGWVIGVSCGAFTNTVLARALIRDGAVTFGPANWITLSRATLVGAVAALVADSFGRPAPVSTMAGLTAVALLLDWCDGRVARRTGTVSAVGARFDMEVDAFLILVLAVYEVRLAGGWVLAIGLARYLFVAAGWLLPWLAGRLPPRYWRKVVAAIQGIALVVALTGRLPGWFADVTLAVALALLVESFGRDVWWRWRHRTTPDAATPTTTVARSGKAAGPVRRVAGRATTGLAGLVVWCGLVAPDNLDHLEPSAFLRVPVEGLVFIALLLVLPPRVGRWMTAIFGVALGLITIVKIFDMGFLAALDRPFNPMSDWSYLGPAIGVLDDSIGRAGALTAVAAAAISVIAMMVFVPLAVRRLSRLLIRHRAVSSRFVTAFGALWIVGALLGVQVAPGAPLASAGATGLALDQVDQIRAGIKDQATFATAITHDPASITPAADLLTGLRGKDVIVAFVESYGRVALQDSAFSPAVGAVLDTGTKQLQAAGFSARSAFLTSPTFGGISWLAHSTLQSGLWVDSQLRYDQLVASDRYTLTDAFGRAGWRTVGDVPSNYKSWPEGTSFYHYDRIYDAHNVGYQGPSFSYANMPDQYILSAFQRRELANPQHAPVMAEIDLESSHTPWTPLPRLVDWNAVGDGSVFDGQPDQGQTPDAVWRNHAAVGAAYGQSIEYSLHTLISFVQTYGNQNLVLIVLGDHQPAEVVSGAGASHDVPISIIAHDPTVTGRISGWGWQDGLNPGPQAPVWPMSSFRDRFLGAFDR